MVASQAGQRITHIIIALYIIELFQGIDGCLVIPGAVLRGGLPGGIGKQLSRIRIIPGIHRPLSLLILAQPQPLPVQRVNRIRRRKQHKRQHQDITAAEQQGGQRQQAQYEPGALFTPDIRGYLGSGLLAAGLHGRKISRQQPGVLIVFCHSDINPPT